MTAVVVISVIVIWILISACITISACVFSSQFSHAEESPLRFRRFKQALDAEPVEEPEGPTVPASPNANPSH